jgi:hypothetical protein
MSLYRPEQNEAYFCLTHEKNCFMNLYTLLMKHGMKLLCVLRTLSHILCNIFPEEKHIKNLFWCSISLLNSTMLSSSGSCQIKKTVNCISLNYIFLTDA